MNVSGRIVMRTALAALIGLVCIAAGNEERREVAELYRRGLEGDTAAVNLCIEKLEAALAADSRNELARVYLGSCYTLRSRDMGFGPKKLSTVKEGCALMDAAVAAAPNSHKVRLVRALTDQSLPFFLGRKKSALSDWDNLLALAEKDSAAMERADLQVIYYNCALVARGRGDERRAMELLARAEAHPADPAVAQKVKTAREKK